MLTAAGDGFAQIKVIISAGGRFVKSKDGTEYQGGETRLMQLTQHATHADVLEALDRCAGPGGSNITSAGSASSAGSVCFHQTPLLPKSVMP